MNFSKPLGVQQGEVVASVGAGNGYIEAQISCFVPNVSWTLQDIDSGCLNEEEFQKVKAYHERLLGSSIQGTFTLVLGEEEQTNLLRNTYDRVILVNVYHELSGRKPMMEDIYGALKANGVVVMMERMAKKPGERHGDCKQPKLLETELLIEMDSFGFVTASPLPNDTNVLSYYTFKKK